MYQTLNRSMSSLFALYPLWEVRLDIQIHVHSQSKQNHNTSQF